MIMLIYCIINIKNKFETMWWIIDGFSQLDKTEKKPQEILKLMMINVFNKL